MKQSSTSCQANINSEGDYGTLYDSIDHDSRKLRKIDDESLIINNKYKKRKLEYIRNIEKIKKRKNWSQLNLMTDETLSPKLEKPDFNIALKNLV